jgi:hypothetical protein
MAVLSISPGVVQIEQSSEIELSARSISYSITTFEGNFNNLNNILTDNSSAATAGGFPLSFQIDTGASRNFYNFPMRLFFRHRSNSFANWSYTGKVGVYSILNNTEEFHKEFVGVFEENIYSHFYYANANLSRRYFLFTFSPDIDTDYPAEVELNIYFLGVTLALSAPPTQNWGTPFVGAPTINSMTCQTDGQNNSWISVSVTNTHTSTATITTSFESTFSGPYTQSVAASSSAVFTMYPSSGPQNTTQTVYAKASAGGNDSATVSQTQSFSAFCQFV